MLKLVADDVPSIEDFMTRYRVCISLRFFLRLGLMYLLKMDNPAALHRIKVGVPATVEHSSEAGPETGKWVAETTQVRALLFPIQISSDSDVFYLTRALSHSWMRCGYACAQKINYIPSFRVS